MTPDEVARIVERCDEPAFADLLRMADGDFQQTAFESEVADVLRLDQPLIDKWNIWSGDQRWTPSAGVDGVRTIWVPDGGGAEHLRVHPDAASAVADFIHRMAVWLARRDVLTVGGHG